MFLLQFTKRRDSDLHVATFQAFIKDRASFYVTRAFIGLLEGGFIPGTILMATYFYTSRELSVRLAAFWSTLNVASKFIPPQKYSDFSS